MLIDAYDAALPGGRRFVDERRAARAQSECQRAELVPLGLHGHEEGLRNILLVRAELIAGKVPGGLDYLMGVLAGLDGDRHHRRLEGALRDPVDRRGCHVVAVLGGQEKEAVGDAAECGLLGLLVHQSLPFSDPTQSYASTEL